MSQMSREGGTVSLLLPQNHSSRAFQYRQTAFSACNRIEEVKKHHPKGNTLFVIKAHEIKCELS